MAHRDGSRLHWGLFPAQGGVFCACPGSCHTWTQLGPLRCPRARPVLIPEQVPCSQFHLHIRHPAIFSLPWFTGWGGCANPKEPLLGPGVWSWLGHCCCCLGSLLPLAEWEQRRRAGQGAPQECLLWDYKGDGDCRVQFSPPGTEAQH